ncbi:MAG: family 1 glycosylhydrolase, partial [Candidatus Omnitrophota bacterium]|nr:family 1 glycosylhydrolase [Candidatus Omnitrophota bacterium]
LGRHSFKKATNAFVNLLKAHCLAYNAIHRIYKEEKWPSPQVSLSKLHILFTPCRKTSILDAFSAWIRGYYFNKLFTRSLITGWCAAPGFPLTRLPAKKSLDFISVNYYSRDFVHYGGISLQKIFGNICTLIHHKNAGKRNFLKWEIYPKGIYRVLMEYSAYNLPIMITENGICTNDDNDRIDFIKGHLREVARAIKDGLPVFGYLHWSLIDNFEWAHGYAPRFGLIEMDYAAQRRTVRPSARIYAEIIKNS